MDNEAGTELSLEKLARYVKLKLPCQIGDNLMFSPLLPGESSTISIRGSLPITTMASLPAKAQRAGADFSP